MHSRNPAIHILLALMLGLLFPDHVHAGQTDNAAGTVIEIEVSAPSLAGNLLGTPTVQSAAVYLPRSYEHAPDRRYPVIYLLHGIFDDHGVWSRFFDLPGRLDRLIAAGEIPDLIVVMPDGGNLYGGGFYRNSPVSGHWADYIAEDLVEHVDTRFRTVADAGARAIVGHSMGGYGAIHLAMTRPGVFSSVWAMSPCCLASAKDISLGNDAWKRAFAVATLADLETLYDRRDYIAIAALGVATAFGTEAGAAPIHASFPFEVIRGEVVVDPMAYDGHLDAFAIRQVAASRDALRALRGLALDVGLNDQFRHIPPTTLAFSARLGDERIPHRLEVYDGDHREHVGERLESVVLPWIGSRLVAR